jgi:hypothetical protein
MKKIDINPALKNIEMLAGEWAMELSNASFLPDPNTTIKGSVSFEWLENGDFLVMRQGEKNDSMWATWLIGHDEDSQNYTVLYIDNRRVSRVYDMSFEKDVWKIWRNAPGFSQRFVGKISKDKKIIKAYWEKSADGKTWEHDFDMLFKRIA